MNTTGSLEPEERFHKYTLEVLPSDSRLWIDRQTQTVLVLDGDCNIVGLEILTDTEWLLMLALLANIPPFCTYEKLYAAFYRMTYKQALEQLQEAWNSPAWNLLMRQVRNVLSRLRIKIRPLGFEISNISETGYTFVSAGRRFMDEKDS